MLQVASRPAVHPLVGMPNLRTSVERDLKYQIDNRFVLLLAFVVVPDVVAAVAAVRVIAGRKLQ